MVERRAYRAFILIYYGLFVAVRMLVSDSAAFDESDEIIFSQAFLWGHGAHPPLYSWGVRIFSSVIGTGILALTIFKAAVLAAAMLLVERVAGKLLPSARLAAAAVLSYFLVVEIGWESLKDRSNDVLLFAICALNLHLFLRLHDRRRETDYVLWGVCAGLGMLTRYNFVLFIAPLCLAALMGHDTRKSILTWKLALAILPAAAITLPHAMWLQDHIGLATGQTLAKLHPGRGGWALAILTGLGSIPVQSFAYLLTLLLVCLVLMRPTLARTCASFITGEECGSEKAPWPTLIRRTIVLGWISVAAFVVGFRFTTFQPRWFQPFLFLFPLYVFLHCRRGDPTDGRIAVLQRVAVGAACIALAILPLRMIVNPFFGVYENEHRPYSALARQLQKDGFRSGQVVLGQDHVIAGNFKIHLDAAIASSPDRNIITPLVEAGRLELSTYRQALIAWHGGDGTMPEELQRWIETLRLDWREREPRHLSMPYKHARGGDGYHLHYIIAGTTSPASAGNQS